ncbi:hypothetical protein EKL30_14675 [Candidimonas sp. SYP-B2681]|uniref:hypothetical protein n=1 Tax=Candidimonas sp. SYP-B2681 TaxID=2497686 RepID=UPI000F88CC35|nr:hypothetical protein [Candidimonas sp. SYP-B2681]RTZ40938.1 hypothetical protein EKL30_14675 [Candidimonas sp. SYP-B2681]
MTKPMPDTDPVKREPPGEISKVPNNDVGGGGRPAGKPEEETPDSKGNRQDNVQPGGDEPTSR